MAALCAVPCVCTSRTPAPFRGGSFYCACGCRRRRAPKESNVLCTQLRTISRNARIIKTLGALRPGTMEKVDAALKVSLALE